jgi:hypothetical protein
MKREKVLLLTIIFIFLISASLNIAVLAETRTKQASIYRSNGDFIEGWNWLRDSALQHYAEWTFDEITPGSEDLVLEMTALATDRPSGGRGFEAKFTLIYGFPGSGNMGGVFKTKVVTLPNVSPAGDPLGYNCQGQVTVDRAFIPNASAILFRIERESAQDNHIAFKKDSIVLMVEEEEFVEEDEEPPLEGDQLPETDTWGGAILIQPGTYTGRLGEEDSEGHRDNDDYYRLEVEKGQLITLQLIIPGNASYNLSLLNPNRNSRGSSITQRDTKTLDYVADSSGTWYIRISRSSGEGEYQLSLEIENQNDADSGQDTGDSYQEAIPISSGTYNGLLKAGDNDDYYRLEVEKGQLITLQLIIPGNASYNLSLLNPNRNSRGSSITQRDTKTLDYVADSTGTWYIRVSRSSGEGEYQLSINVEDQNDADSGQDTGDSYQEAIPISSGTYKGLLKAGDNDDYYSINLVEDEQISLELTVPGNASYNLTLLNPNRNSRGSSVTQLDTKTLDYVADSTGTWYIRVSRSSGEGEYQLLVNDITIGSEGEENHPPIISSLITSQNVVEANQIANITCHASDQDGDTLTFSWTATGEVVGGNNSSLSWSAPDTAGTYNIICTVNDGMGGEDSSSVNIVVTSGTGGDDSTCSFTLSSYEAHFSSSGGNGEFTVTPSSSDCQWTAESDSSWIQINSGGAGPGSKVVTFSVQENGTEEERIAHITIGNEIYSIIQEIEITLTLPQPNGESIPYLTSCRGACGSGCPDTCVSLPDLTIRVPDPINELSHYLLTYTGVTECGTHAGCRWHDACFDQCKILGEEGDFDPMHDLCSAKVVQRYGAADGASWAMGNDPYDGYLLFSNEPSQEGPFPGSVHSLEEANYRIDIETGSIPGAGTDANVYLTLFGTDGSSSTEVLLDNSGINDFEMGSYDTFFVRLKNFEDINRIRLRHDNSFSISGSISIGDIIPSSLSIDNLLPGSFTIDDLIPVKISLDDLNTGNLSLDDLIPESYTIDDLIPGSFSIDDVIPSNISLDDLKPGSFTINDIISDSLSSISGFVSSILSLADIDLGNFTLSDLVPGSISLDDIIPGSISISDLIPGSYSIDDLKPGNITLGDFAPGSVTWEDIKPGSITLADLIPGSFSLDDIIPGDFLAGWFVKSVRIMNQDTGQLWHFKVNRWLAEDEGDGLIDVQFTPSHKDERDYQIEVYTGEISSVFPMGEGTDSDIYITLFGTNGFNTGEIYLNYPNQNNFEAGAHDVFCFIRSANIGELHRIILRSDYSGIGSDWYCEKIKVKEVTQGAENGEWYIPGIPKPLNWESGTGRVWEIPVNAWLTDGNPVRTCYPR